jgi:hypothetical protein
MNDRPPQLQLWNWPAQLEPGRITRSAAAPTSPATPVRIGDAERDEAASTLGDHFAAGRLTREEFDTRADQAMAARFDSDLHPLFADLPRSPRAAASVPAPVAPTAVPMRSAVPMLLMAMLPVLMVSAVVAAVVLSAPGMLWMFLWVAVMAPFWGRRAHPGHFHRR